MRTLFALVLLVCLAVNAPVNAQPTPPGTTGRVYINSEQLAINICQDEARFKGVFTYNYVDEVLGREKTNDLIYLKIPIWFPEHNSEDPTVAAFWSAFQKDALNQITPGNREVFDKAVGLDITLGDHPVNLNSFYAIGLGNNQDWAPEGWQKTNYNCLVFVVTEPNDFVHAKAPVTVTWRQPHMVFKNKKYFYYIPNFRYLPENISTATSDKYTVHLTAARDCTSDVTIGPRQFFIHSGRGIVTGPRHHVPVEATILRPEIPVVSGPRGF
ncbi:hypothetical protein [Pedosphaera parvula]|uniref:Uncharacterized protein n=1 Tax=Pedosphaera parvula (strain Ellin514) TaxID=320771 RepID=B9XGS9_PEDPL|nr:hypothetical protein [Pedosphaera parvula]EEF60850.1 hypothetical protein Cflav_PD4019 [Pedosphaera parvula Ellin514]